MKATETELTAAIHAVLAAGAEILEVYAREFSVEEKADRSPLTEADTRGHHAILRVLAAATPDIPLLSEEGAAIDYADLPRRRGGAGESPPRRARRGEPILYDRRQPFPHEPRDGGLHRGASRVSTGTRSHHRREFDQDMPGSGGERRRVPAICPDDGVGYRRR